MTGPYRDWRDRPPQDEHEDDCPEKLRPLIVRAREREDRLELPARTTRKEFATGLAIAIAVVVAALLALGGVFDFVVAWAL